MKYRFPGQVMALYADGQLDKVKGALDYPYINVSVELVSLGTVKNLL
jgi:hypothetical protein